MECFKHVFLYLVRNGRRKDLSIASKFLKVSIVPTILEYMACCFMSQYHDDSGLLKIGRNFKKKETLKRIPILIETQKDSPVWQNNQRSPLH